MSTLGRAIRAGQPEAPDPDGWDHHWAYGEAAEGKHNRGDFPLGWQMAAVARVPGAGPK